MPRVGYRVVELLGRARVARQNTPARRCKCSPRPSDGGVLARPLVTVKKAPSL